MLMSAVGLLTSLVRVHVKWFT